jgi:uncharacterized OsmC-like protein
MNMITVRRKSGLAFEVRVRQRRVSTDMPPVEGGGGSGFTPAELLAGSLGSCVASAVQSYCDACGLSEGDVSVNLAFEFMGKHRRIGAIAVDVEVPAGVPEDKREEVRRVAEGAVICETLKHPPEVDVDILFHEQPQSGSATVGAVGK